MLKEIMTLYSARQPVMMMITQDETYVINKMRKGLKTPVFTWSVNKGLRNDVGEVLADIHEPIAILDWLENEEAPDGIYCLSGFHYFLYDFGTIHTLKELATAIRRGQRKSVLILAPEAVTIPPELEKETVMVPFSGPGKKEMGDMVERALSACQSWGFKRSERIGEISDCLHGLTRLEAENIMARLIVEKGELKPEDVLREKVKVLDQSGFLTYSMPTAKLGSVGGMGNLKKWLLVRTKLIKSGLNHGEVNRYRLRPPKGILLIGTQGCGKSFLASHIAGQWGLPLLSLDMGRIFSSLIGSSEQNIRTVLSQIEALSPAVLLFDEMEKGLAGVHSSSFSDSGTTARVFATFLTWLSDRRNRVFIVATANRIDALPPELLRKGRFDEIFFVDLPSKLERREIFRIHLIKHNLQPNLYDLDLLAGKSEGYSGAEIEQAIVSVCTEALFRRTDPGTLDLVRVIKESVPLSATMREDIEIMRQWASSRARPAGNAVSRHSGSTIPFQVSRIRH